MCTLSSISLLITVTGYFKFVLAFYILLTGVIISTSSDILKGLGLIFTDFGTGLILLGLLSGGLVFPMRFGVFKHNRFLLMMCFVLDTIVFVELIVIGLDIGSYAISDFPKGLQTDCLRYVPEKYGPAQCQDFYDSDRTAGMRLVWESYYTNKALQSSAAMLSKLEVSCCGFFAPFRCLNNTAPFPTDRDMSGISAELLDQRVTCGFYSGYYPVQSDCRNMYDVENGIVGGCYYDMGIDFCLAAPVYESTAGCASGVEDYVVLQISGLPAAMIACSLMNLLFMLLACCMWWKRKETDVFPEFQATKLRKIDYAAVRHQFEVFPKKDLLRTEGFLPSNETKEDEHELAFKQSQKLSIKDEV